MLLRITRREVLKELNRTRWKKYFSGPNVLVDGKTADYWTRGVPREDFTEKVFTEACVVGLLNKNFIYKILFKLHRNLRKSHFERFGSKIDDVLDKACEDGLIKIVHGDRLILTSKGDDLISWHYYWRLFLRHPITGNIIKWGSITLIVWILARYGISIENP